MPESLPRIIHVTESLCTGVLSALSVLSTEQARAGCDVTIVHVRRPETPSRAELAAMLPGVRRLEVRGGWTPMAAVRLLGRTRHVLDEFHQPGAGHDVVVVHLHSSWAGFLGRVARFSLRRAQVLYTPHAFAFLREDAHRFTAGLIRFAERLLANRARIVAVSASEAAAAVSVGARRVSVLENRIPDPQVLTDARPAFSVTPFRVVTAGRICPQKAPSFVAEVARRLPEPFEFVWIGGEPHTMNWFGEAPVHVVAHRDRADVLEMMGGAQAFLLLSKWEGMSVALIEAQCMGLPAVVSDIPGNVDVVGHHSTGFVCPDVDAAVSALQQLAEDPALWRRMSQVCRENGRERFLAGSLASQSLLAYSSD